MNDSRRNRNRLIVLSGIFFVIYCVTVVPVGLFLYNLKTEAGVNVFKRGGYHTYLRCLAVATELRDMPVKPKAPKPVEPLPAQPGAGKAG